MTVYSLRRGEGGSDLLSRRQWEEMESWSRFEHLGPYLRVDQALQGPWVQEQVHLGEESVVWRGRLQS